MSAFSDFVIEHYTAHSQETLKSLLARPNFRFSHHGLMNEIMIIFCCSNTLALQSRLIDVATRRKRLNVGRASIRVEMTQLELQFCGDST